MRNHYFGICLRGQFLPLLPCFVMFHLASSHRCSRSCFKHLTIPSVIRVIGARNPWLRVSVEQRTRVNIEEFYSLSLEDILFCTIWIKFLGWFAAVRMTS